jgi:pimeloyl-ACP methyl ester carboxylesterase
MTRRRLAALATVAVLIASSLTIAAGALAGGDGDGFYNVPAHVGRYPIGTTIKSGPAPKVEPEVRRAGRMLRFMYRSESATGAPRAETGVIMVPHGKAPAGGWPVIAWDHGTTGIGTACAPSRTPLLGDRESDYARYLADFVAHGYVVVAPDYEGLGPNGEISPFAELQSEGRSTVDAVRAARGVVAHLSRKWVILGHSQGGQAALGTAEVAGTRAPTLPLLGTVAMAPASHFQLALDILGGKVPPDPATLPEAVYLLLSAQLTDPAFNPATIVSPGIAAGFKLARSACYAQLFDFYEKHPPPRLFEGSWRESEPLRLFASRNDPGNQLSPGPMLIAQGKADKTIPPALTAQLDQHLCAIGQRVDFRTYPGVSHNGIPTASQRDVLAWADARFAGEPAPSNCRRSK